MIDELPEGWAGVELPAIATLNMGQSPPSDTYNTDGKGLPFFQGKAEFGDLYPTPVKYCSRPSKVAEPGDILISVRAPVGPTNLCLQRSCIGRGLAAIRPLGEIPSLYLLYYLRSIEDWLSKQGTGSTFTAISKMDLEQLTVRLAPFAEQRRIVAKLEELLGKVDACQKRLAKIPVLVKRFRQSVLAGACSGRLTTDWRDRNDVDSEWATQPLDELFTMRNGKSLIAKKRRDGDIPVYGGNGRMGTHDEANAEGQVIVVGRVGAQCGNVHHVSGKVWVTDNAISLQAKKQVVPEFYAWFLRSQNLNQLSSGTGQPYVSQEILGPVETPLVSLVEQQEVVRRVGALFGLAAQIEKRYTKSKMQMDRFTPSLLAKAFRGELVATEAELARAEGRDYEPAAALLEHIRKAGGSARATDAPRRFRATRRTLVRKNR